MKSNLAIEKVQILNSSLIKHRVLSKLIKINLILLRTMRKFMWFLSCEGRAFNKMQITGGRMLAFQRWNLQLDR